MSSEIFESVFGEDLEMRTQLLACDFAQHELRQVAYLAEQSDQGIFDPAARAACWAAAHLAAGTSLKCLVVVAAWTVHAAGEDESKWQGEQLGRLLK